MDFLLVITVCFTLQGLPIRGEDDSLLTTEGQEGWLESVLQASSDDFMTDMPTDDLNKRADDLQDITEKPMYKQFLEDLDKNLPSDKATTVKGSLKEMTSNWKSKPYTERNAMVSCLQSAARNLNTFANTKDDPIKSIQAGMEIVGSFAMVLGGPYGQVIGAALPFVSTFLSMFGKGKEKPESMESILKRQIDQALDQFYEKTLSNEVDGTISMFRLSKAFLDGTTSGGTVSDMESFSLACHVPVYQGIKFMGILATEINKLVKANSFYSDRKKCLKYIELYAEMATLKNIILEQMAAILPASQESIRNGIMEMKNTLLDTQRNMIKFLYESDADNNILVSYDPNIYTSIDKYALEVLKIPDYDRTLSGDSWCLELDGMAEPSLTWFRVYEMLLVNGLPYITFDKLSNCFWQLVPHGKNLFSIVNNYKCPSYDFCSYQLSWATISSGVYRVFLLDTGGVMWEITEYNGRYRIRNKWGCTKKHATCDREFGQQQEVAYYEGDMLPTFPVKKPTGGMLSKGSVGYKWKITK